MSKEYWHHFIEHPDYLITQEKQRYESQIQQNETELAQRALADIDLLHELAARYGYRITKEEE